jgi:hypothetical protein
LAQRARTAWGTLKYNPVLTKLKMLGGTFVAYVLPRPELLDGETIQLELRPAPYRDAIPRRILQLWWLIILISLLLMLLLGYLAVLGGNSPFVGILGFFPLMLVAWAIDERLQYEQWRLILTNWRTIIFMPDPKAWGRVDSIRMGAGKISVIDTNFSPSAWWGIFQTWTGARDLVISMSGYAFKEGRAEVQGGLTIPDVMPGDIKKLEEKVFGKK